MLYIIFVPKVEAVRTFSRWGVRLMTSLASDHRRVKFQVVILPQCVMLSCLRKWFKDYLSFPQMTPIFLSVRKLFLKVYMLNICYLVEEIGWRKGGIFKNSNLSPWQSNMRGIKFRNFLCVPLFDNCCPLYRSSIRVFRNLQSLLQSISSKRTYVKLWLIGNLTVLCQSFSWISCLKHIFAYSLGPITYFWITSIKMIFYHLTALGMSP